MQFGHLLNQNMSGSYGNYPYNPNLPMGSAGGPVLPPPPPQTSLPNSLINNNSILPQPGLISPPDLGSTANSATPPNSQAAQNFFQGQTIMRKV